MRIKKAVPLSEYKILVLDDEIGIIDSLSVVLQRNGYGFEGVTSPLEAIEKIRAENYDLLILDYMMTPINGDKVVEKIREFNDELYILLLTGHKDLAPPLETIKALDIQGYCEKNDRFDQLILLVESAIKSIKGTARSRVVTTEYLWPRNMAVDAAASVMSTTGTSSSSCRPSRPCSP